MISSRILLVLIFSIAFTVLVSLDGVVAPFPPNDPRSIFFTFPKKASPFFPEKDRQSSSFVEIILTSQATHVIRSGLVLEKSREYQNAYNKGALFM